MEGSGTGLGYINGQPYPKGWPANRPRFAFGSTPTKSILEAFRWPEVAKKNLEAILENHPPENGTPLVTTGKRLKISSHFSGVCTQSRAAAVLEQHQVGVSFEYARVSFYSDIVLAARTILKKTRCCEAQSALCKNILLFPCLAILRSPSANGTGKDRAPCAGITLQHAYSLTKVMFWIRLRKLQLNRPRIGLMQ